jgi:serine/threonine protein kinase
MNAPSGNPNSSAQAALDRALDDPRVFDAVQEYLVALEAGQRPSRVAFLDRHPEIRASLAECLDALQFVHSAAGRPAPSAAGPAPAWQGEQHPAVPLGDFQILRELGRGGMGIVYEAVQLSLGRRVALKVLPFAAGLDVTHLQRFKTESQAAALLHHANIVPVYAVGCERGTHFYAMQLIEGQSVAALIHQLRQQAGRDPAAAGEATTGPYLPAEAGAAAPSAPTRPVAELSTERSGRGGKYFRSVARLGVQAASALEHAHQMGIVHRDVKPANLLVDGRGNLWVTDFGLAQFHHDAGLTRTGDLVGTLRYMSPEQALGQRALLDHRTDVYSLGVTLYEMLTLEPAFAGNDRQDLLRRLADDEPRPPRSIDRAIPVELETIVLKAISKSPADRYASAQALADDMQRFLDEQPILARRPTLLDRARKWSRRHPAAARAAVGLLVLVIGALFVHNRQIDAERQKAQDAYNDAEQRFKQARGAVDLLVQVGEQELADRPDLTSVRKKLLTVALAYYQDFTAQHAELATEQDHVKRILADLSALDGAFRGLLLEQDCVRENLHLSPRQLEKIDELVNERARSFGRLDRHASWEEFNRHFVERAIAEDKALAHILEPEQQHRLKQIWLQWQGLRAFREPEVVDALHLTAEQRDKIRGIEKESFGPGPFGHPDGPRGFGRGRGDGRPPGHTGRRGRGPDAGDRSEEPELRRGGQLDAAGAGPEDFEQKQRDALAQVLAKILNKEQGAKWQGLIGEPFSRPRHLCRAGPGPH